MFVVCCCLLLFVVVCCCLLLFVVVCCCLLLLVVVAVCVLLLVVVLSFKDWAIGSKSVYGLSSLALGGV